MLIEIVSYKYKSHGFPYVFLDYSQDFKYWAITWRNPADFNNGDSGFMDKLNINTHSDTPNEACIKALKFIKDNPHIFEI